MEYAVRTQTNLDVNIVRLIG